MRPDRPRVPHEPVIADHAPDAGRASLVPLERAVVYSVALSDSEPRPDLVRQFELSVGTLRRYSDVPVVLFLHGSLPRELALACNDHGVLVHDQGPLEARLARLCPAGWPALVRYRLLHKLLNFRELAAAGVAQALYCDCDTVFLADVDRLFERYAGPDVVAREEVHTSRSPHGADPTFVDEPMLARIAAVEGIAVVPPFNLGVILFNHGVGRRLADLEALFVDYAWRLVSWMALHPVDGVSAAFGEFAGAAEARALLRPEDVARALPYPSSNRWLLEEVALWLALGHLRGLTVADFDPAVVAENGELATARSGDLVVGHYYTQNMSRIDAWLRSAVALI